MKKRIETRWGHGLRLWSTLFNAKYTTRLPTWNFVLTHRSHPLSTSALETATRLAKVDTRAQQSIDLGLQSIYLHHRVHDHTKQHLHNCVEEDLNYHLAVKKAFVVAYGYASTQLQVFTSVLLTCCSWSTQCSLIFT